MHSETSIAAAELFRGSGQPLQPLVVTESSNCMGTIINFSSNGL